MYRSGRPNRLARLLNRISAIQFSAGILAPNHWVTLVVPGRRTGRRISFPLVVADYEGERYLVAMLGQNANWVRNVRAAGGRAVLRHGRRQAVRLDEVDPGARAPILRRYLAVAPGARAHIPVDRGAPLEEFERIAAQIPMFRVTADQPDPTTPTDNRPARAIVAAHRFDHWPITDRSRGQRLVHRSITRHSAAPPGLKPRDTKDATRRPRRAAPPIPSSEGSRPWVTPSSHRSAAPRTREPGENHPAPDLAAAPSRPDTYPKPGGRTPGQGRSPSRLISPTSQLRPTPSSARIRLTDHPCATCRTLR